MCIYTLRPPWVRDRECLGGESDSATGHYVICNSKRQHVLGEKHARRAAGEAERTSDLVAHNRAIKEEHVRHPVQQVQNRGE